MRLGEGNGFVREKEGSFALERCLNPIKIYAIPRTSN